MQALRKNHVLAGWLAGLCLAAVSPAAAWEAPAHWQDLGTVAEWRDLDARFYRSRVAAATNESREHLDQPGIYERTRVYRGRLEGIGPERWQELGAAEKSERRRAAAHELRYLREFRNRLANEAHKAHAGLTVSWGTGVADHTVVGDILSRLRAANGLDPANPYAWHLHAYFATAAGDGPRARRALAGATAALDLVPPDELAGLRAAVALDAAWLARDAGEFTAAHDLLAEAVDHGAAGPETRLLQGLLAAQTGDDQLAITAATELRGTLVKAFPVNYRSRDFLPEVTHVAAWRNRPSSYLHDWIMAYTWLRAGRPDLAAVVFGPYKLDDQRPFAHRFWNEAGAIYAATGRQALAAAAWQQARVSLPFHPYMLGRDRAHDLSGLTGRPGELPFHLAYGRHYRSGSRVAYAADLVEKLAAAADDHTRHRLATRALDELEACRRFGLFAGQAAVLEGQVYHLMGDRGAAAAAVGDALALLDAAGDRAAFAAVLSGLNRERAELESRDVARFYGQAGSSRGRWASEDDPAAARAALEAAYAADGSPANRRALARFLVRQGDPAAGRELATAALAGAALDPGNIRDLSAADLALVLEADRAAGEGRVARLMVDLLAAGAPDPWTDSGVWALAGFICMDQGWQKAGRTALEHAVTLDPGNHGLRLQLSLM